MKMLFKVSLVIGVILGNMAQGAEITSTAPLELAQNTTQSNTQSNPPQNTQNTPTNSPQVGSDSSSSGQVNPGTSTKRTIGTAIDDGIITTKVKTSLMADPDIKGLDIIVETRKGEVLLSGFVDSQVQIQRAINIAQRIEGVKSVNNKMALKK